MSRLPIDRPGKVICVGRNYREHASELGNEVPAAPMLFAKWQTCLIGHGEAIVLPAIAQKVDWEGELGVVIGRGAKGVSADDALDLVATPSGRSARGSSPPPRSPTRSGCACARSSTAR